MDTLPNLDALYKEAQAALAAKDLRRAAALLKQILLTDENYKDASRLLAQVVARQRRRWYEDTRLWFAVGVVAFLAILFLYKDTIIGMLIKPQPTEEVIAHIPTSTSEPTKILVQTVTPTPINTPTAEPTSVPLYWRRLYSGAIFPRAEISTIAVDPNDPDVIYVGTYGAGIYMSLNGGLSWQPALTNLGLRNILALAIDPWDGKTIYVGTDAAGFYKTQDAGIHWKRINASGNDLVIDQLNNQHLILADGGLLIESMDGGKYWSNIRQTSPCPSSYDKLAIDPDNEDILYALSSGACGDLDWGHRIFGSTDGGNHWVLLDQRSGNVGLLDVETASNGDVYSLTGLRGGGDGILRSTDGGKTWNWFAQLSLRGGEHGAMLISPEDLNSIIVGSVGLQISRDGGSSWEVRQDGLGITIINLIINPDDPQNLFIEGPDVEWRCPYYRSVDGGQTWKEMGKDWCGMTIDADGMVYISGKRSWDQARSWDETSEAGGIILAADPRASGLLYGDGFTSTNGGVTWLPSGQLGFEHDTRLFIGEDILYAFDRGRLRYSPNHGRTWLRCGEPVGWLPSTNARAAIDPTNDKRVYLATRSGGVQLSINGCQSWRSVNRGLGNLFVNTVAIDPENLDIIYAGTDGGAYVSFDGGEHWGEINDGLLGATVVYSIVIDPQSNVYAATPYGIFKLEGR
jgi:photosystem II stability/assembly factor-like uncharacterized protein